MSNPCALSVTPASAKTPIGVPVYLSAEAKYEDGVSHDVTKDVQWNSSDRNIAIVDETGLVMPVAVGTVEISAVLGEFSGITTLEVTDAALESISIDSETGVFATPVGVELNLSALGTYSDGTTRDVTDRLLWSAEGKATVADGVVTPTGVGEASITVRDIYRPTLTDTAVITITEAVPTSLTIGSETGEFIVAAGGTLQLTLETEYTDGTTADVTLKDAVKWSSDSSVVLTVSYGEAKGLRIGKAKVTAEFEGVKVSQEIEVKIVLQTLTLISETGKFATDPFTGFNILIMANYSDGHSEDITMSDDVRLSGDESALHFVKDTESGKLQLIPYEDYLGWTTISAEYKGISVSQEVSIRLIESDNVESDSGSFVTTLGNPLQLRWHIHYTDGTDEYLNEGLHWDSLDKNVATVDANGLVTPVSVGNTRIVLYRHGAISRRIDVLAE
ncbi:MAG: Ig-like domain-containing protein [bacterium]|nr:Ig-like domain-containing protein [bacterium]